MASRSSDEQRDSREEEAEEVTVVTVACVEVCAGLEGASALGLDVGGTLVKACVAAEGRLHLLQAPTAAASVLLAEAFALLPEPSASGLAITGGGARRVRAQAGERLREALLLDEMQALAAGARSLHASALPHPPAAHLPVVVTVVGSGTSVILVEEGSSKRLDGSCLGGGTFRGLCRLVTGLDFEEAMACASEGKAEKVDLTVGDIYGADYCEAGLSADIVASCMGKAPEQGSAAASDVCASLAQVVGLTAAQLAVLHAKAQSVSRVLFCGAFVGPGTKAARAAVSMGVEFYSAGGLTAEFHPLSTFFGAIGAATLAAPAAKKCKEAQQ